MTTYKMAQGKEKNKATAAAATVPTSTGVRVVSTLAGKEKVKSDLQSTATTLDKTIGSVLEKSKQLTQKTQSSQEVAPTANIVRRGR